MLLKKEKRLSRDKGWAIDKMLVEPSLEKNEKGIEDRTLRNSQIKMKTELQGGDRVRGWKGMTEEGTANNSQERKTEGNALAERVEPCSVAPREKCAVFVNRELVSYLSQGWCGEAVRSRNQMAVNEVGREAKGTGAGPVNYPFLSLA